MKIERLPEPFDVLVIKDTFSKNEAGQVRNELGTLFQKQEGAGLWLSEMFSDLETSATHMNTVGTFFSQEVSANLMNINNLYGLYSHVNNHSTIIKYYGQGQSSTIHYDSAAFTIMTFMFDEPKKFTGGDLTVQIGGDIAYEQPVENNMSVIFPSSYYVGLTEVDITDNSVEQAGLHVITTYLFIESR